MDPFDSAGISDEIQSHHNIIGSGVACLDLIQLLRIAQPTTARRLTHPSPLGLACRRTLPAPAQSVLCPV